MVSVITENKNLQQLLIKEYTLDIYFYKMKLDYTQ